MDIPQRFTTLPLPVSFLFIFFWHDLRWNTERHQNIFLLLLLLILLFMLTFPCRNHSRHRVLFAIAAYREVRDPSLLWERRSLNNQEDVAGGELSSSSRYFILFQCQVSRQCHKRIDDFVSNIVHWCVYLSLPSCVGYAFSKMVLCNAMMILILFFFSEMW